MADEIMTFDEILADPVYKSEFDRRVTKALSTVQAKLDAEVEKNKKYESQASGETVESLKQQLSELQKKYGAETEQYKSQIADRDYSDAIGRAIAGQNLKFSSKAAERDFVARLKEKKLELKDGELQGVEEFVKAQREMEPDAFALDKPTPKFVSTIGGGGVPQPKISKAAQIAAEYQKNLYGAPKESDK